MEFVEFFLRLEDLGMMDAFLPFFLLFTVNFAILTNVNVLGKEKKSLNAVLASIIALIPVILHVTGKVSREKDAVIIINESIPVGVGIGIALVAFFFIIGAFKGAPNLEITSVGSWVIGLALLFFVNFAFPNIPFWVALLSAFIIIIVASRRTGDSNQAASAMVFLIIVAIMYIFGSNVGFFQELPNWMDNRRILTFIVAVIVFIAVAAFITGGEGS